MRFSHRFLSNSLKILLGLVLIAASAPQLAQAQPSSDNYQLNDYSFGTGGSAQGLNSSSFTLYGLTGQSISGSQQSPNYTFGGGLGYTSQSQIPDQPSITNPHQYYDRLLIKLDSSADQPDTTYAFAVSSDDWDTTQYIATSGLIKSQAQSTDFQSYQDWGGSDGFLLTGLQSNTTYKIKVRAKKSGLGESDYSDDAQAKTTVPSLTFTIDGSANMGIWREDNNYSSTAISQLTTSTNAYHGYQIYAYATKPLTRQSGSETIANYTGTYANPGSWQNGEGFGYTTNDALVQGQLKWNANPCPADGGSPLCYAAFSQSAPGDVVVDHQEEAKDGPIENQQFEITYKAVTNPAQIAGTYSTTIIYTIAPSF